jgi:hypothetical protein
MYFQVIGAQRGALAGGPPYAVWWGSFLTRDAAEACVATVLGPESTADKIDDAHHKSVGFNSNTESVRIIDVRKEGR